MNDINYTLFYICQNGNMDEAKFFFDCSGNLFDWNQGLCGACSGGHIDIAELMILKGADDWDSSMACACKGGYMNTVKLMISKGANWWDEGLFEACRSGHMVLAKFMISKGATNFEHRCLHNIMNIYNNSPEAFQAYKKKLQLYFTTQDFQEILLNIGAEGKGLLGRVTARGTGVISKVIEMNA